MRVWVGLAPWLLACSEQPQPLLGEGFDSGGRGSSGGANGVGGVAGAGEAPASAKLATGEWVLFGFEHPVAVNLELRGGRDRLLLGGPGCVGAPAYRPGCASAATLVECGEVLGVGEFNGSRLNFSLDFENDASYTADVYVEEPGQRMVGSFSAGVPGTTLVSYEALPWLRLQAASGDCGSLSGSPSPNLSLLDDLAGLNGNFVLQGSEPVGWLEPGKPYALLARKQRNHYVIGGRFGAFWSADLSWDPGTHTLHAGPVSPTIPGMPVELVARLNAENTVSEMEVVLADGQRGVVLPARATP